MYLVKSYISYKLFKNLMINFFLFLLLRFTSLTQRFCWILLLLDTTSLIVDPLQYGFITKDLLLVAQLHQQ